MGLMVPVLAGYIAYSIADRPGLAVGFTGGLLASSGNALVTGYNWADSTSGFRNISQISLSRAQMAVTQYPVSLVES